MATITIHTNHFAIQLIETSINGILRYDAAHIVRLDKDIFGRNKFSFCVCIAYKGNDFVAIEEAALANPALVFDSSEAAHAAALEAVQSIVDNCNSIRDAIAQIFTGEGYAEQVILEQAEAMQFEAEVEQAEAENAYPMKSDLSRLMQFDCTLKPMPLVFNIESIAEKTANERPHTRLDSTDSTEYTYTPPGNQDSNSLNDCILSESESLAEQAEAENTETETRQAVLGVDCWKKQPNPVCFSTSSRAGVSLLAAQKMIRDGIVYDLNRLKTKLEQVDARIALLEREEAALEQRVTRLSNQDLSDFEPDKAAWYAPELCEAWLRAMLGIAGVELVNLFSPYQDASDVFKIECGCSIEEFRERAHNAGLKPYSIVPIKGTSRSAWLYIQIGKP